MILHFGVHTVFLCTLSCATLLCYACVSYPHYEGDSASGSAVHLSSSLNLYLLWRTKEFRWTYSRGLQRVTGCKVLVVTRNLRYWMHSIFLCVRHEDILYEVSWSFHCMGRSNSLAIKDTWFDFLSPSFGVMWRVSSVGLLGRWAVWRKSNTRPLQLLLLLGCVWDVIEYFLGIYDLIEGALWKFTNKIFFTYSSYLI